MNTSALESLRWRLLHKCTLGSAIIPCPAVCMPTTAQWPGLCHVCDLGRGHVLSVCVMTTSAWKTHTFSMSACGPHFCFSQTCFGKAVEVARLLNFPERANARLSSAHLSLHLFLSFNHNKPPPQGLLFLEGERGTSEGQVTTSHGFNKT